MEQRIYTGGTKDIVHTGKDKYDDTESTREFKIALRLKSYFQDPNPESKQSVKELLPFYTLKLTQNKKGKLKKSLDARINYIDGTVEYPVQLSNRNNPNEIELPQGRYRIDVLKKFLFITLKKNSVTIQLNKYASMTLSV